MSYSVFFYIDIFLYYKSKLKEMWIAIFTYHTYIKINKQKKISFSSTTTTERSVNFCSFKFSHRSYTHILLLSKHTIIIIMNFG